MENGSKIKQKHNFLCHFKQIIFLKKYYFSFLFVYTVVIFALVAVAATAAVCFQRKHNIQSVELVIIQRCHISFDTSPSSRFTPLHPFTMATSFFYLLASLPEPNQPTKHSTSFSLRCTSDVRVGRLQYIYL